MTKVHFEEKRDFEEEVVHIDRISRTIAGGRRIRFRAAVVVGNRAGRVGIGIAKASEVILAVQKAITCAKKHLISVPIINDTIPHEIEENYGAAKVFLKPAQKGTGIIAGGVVRVIMNLAGVKNVLSKILGSQNQINNLKATISALEKLTKPPTPIVSMIEGDQKKSDRSSKIDQVKPVKSLKK